MNEAKILATDKNSKCEVIAMKKSLWMVLCSLLFASSLLFSSSSDSSDSGGSTPNDQATVCLSSSDSGGSTRRPALGWEEDTLPCLVTIRTCYQDPETGWTCHETTEQGTIKLCPTGRRDMCTMTTCRLN